MASIVLTVFGLFWWIMGFPIVCLAASPFILVIFCLGKGSYWARVRGRYRGLIEFWKEYGILFVP